MKKLSMEELGRMSAQEFQESKKFPVAVVLDNVRSLNNVGSAFRSCDAFRAARLLLCGITGTPPHRDIHKTALGADQSMDWAYYPTTREALEALKAEGYAIAVVEQTNRSVLLQDFRMPEQPIAFVFGNEAFGVSEEVLPLADHCLEIPQFGTKHSLNVSVTIGILLWEYVRQQMA